MVHQICEGNYDCFFCFPHPSTWMDVFQMVKINRKSARLTSKGWIRQDHARNTSGDGEGSFSPQNSNIQIGGDLKPTDICLLQASGCPLFLVVAQPGRRPGFLPRRRALLFGSRWSLFQSPTPAHALQFPSERHAGFPFQGKHPLPWGKPSW